MLVTGVVVLVSAVTWAHHLERRTTYPPIIRPSIFTRNNGRVAVVIIIEVRSRTTWTHRVETSRLTERGALTHRLLSQFLCVCGYGGLVYTSNIFYQRYEDMSPSQLMVRGFCP